MRASTGAYGARPRFSISGGKASDYRRVLAVVTFACLVLAPQVRAEPFPAAVGDDVTVTALREHAPVAGLAIAVELPDGTRRDCGATGTDGVLRFRPDRPGYHVFHCTLDGTRVLTPLSVVPASRRWPLALGTVPLGLALLWWNLRPRARDRRGS